jgi:CP family cyanate transporter-like MFS transporter
MEGRAAVTTPPVDPGRYARFLMAASIVLVAFNLRPAFSSIGPVLPEALAGAGLTTAEAWLITTIPVFCLGPFGLAAPRLTARWGMEATVLMALGLLIAGLGLRAIGLAVPLVLGGALAGAAIGLGNVLLPGIIKRDFSDRAPLMTGLYTMALCGGATIAAGATAPLYLAFGRGWSAALAFWAIPAAVAAGFWILEMRRPAVTAPAVSSSPPGGLWRDPLAWQVTLFMGLQSSLAYCTMGWLAPILRDRGLSVVEAGLVLSVSLFFQVPAALAAPTLASRGKDQRPAALITAALTVAGLCGCVFAPLSSLWFWAAVAGVGQGAIFAVALTMVVLRSPDAAVAGRLSSMSQGVGYMLAAAGPLLMGTLHAWTGDWTAPGLMFVALGAGCAVAGWGAGRALHVRPA